MKPKYQDKASFLGEFYSVIRDLDKANPKDPTLLPKAAKAKPALTESVQAPKAPAIKAEAAWMSQYSSKGRALDSFNVLAGLVQTEQMPWNPGIVGETRTVKTIIEDAFGPEGIPIEEQGQTGVVSIGAHAAQYPHNTKGDLGGWTPKAAHRAITKSARVISSAHAHHEIMQYLEPHERDHIKGRLAAASQDASHALRGASDGAPPEVHHQLHDLAARHDRHAKIYLRGGRPKLEAIEALNAMVEAIDLYAEPDPIVKDHAIAFF